MDEDYLAQIKKEMSHIKPFEKDDLDWAFEGQKFLTEEKFDLTEKKFKELVAAQPYHQDGFEGLAYLYYLTGNKEKAIWFMQEAVKRAEEFLKSDTIDMEVIEEMRDNLKRMQDDKPLNRWWEKD